MSSICLMQISVRNLSVELSLLVCMLKGDHWELNSSHMCSANNYVRCICKYGMSSQNFIPHLNFACIIFEHLIRFMPEVQMVSLIEVLYEVWLKCALIATL